MSTKKNKLIIAANDGVLVPASLTVGTENNLLGNRSVVFGYGNTMGAPAFSGGVEFLLDGPNWNNGVVFIQLTNDYFWFNHNGMYSDPSGTGTAHEVYFNGPQSPEIIASVFKDALDAAAISGLTYSLDGARVALSDQNITLGGEGLAAQLQVLGATGDVIPDDSFIGGGHSHTCTGLAATVIAGENNDCSGSFSGVIGGQNNSCKSESSVILGGHDNIIVPSTAAISVILGGFQNTVASGSASAIIGSGNISYADFGFVIGLNSAVNNRGSLVIGENAEDIAARDFVIGNSSDDPSGKNAGHFRVDGSSSDVHIGRYLDQSASGSSNKLYLHTVNESNQSKAVALSAPVDLTSDVAFVLPSSEGSPDQVLQTDGSGMLSWVTMDLDHAYQIGSLVTTSSASGSLEIAGTESFVVSAADGIKLAKNGDNTKYTQTLYKDPLVISAGSNVVVSDLGFSSSEFSGTLVSYSIKDASGAIRVGTLLVATTGSEVSLADTFVETTELDVKWGGTMSGSDVQITCTTTNALTMKAKIDFFLV